MSFDDLAPCTCGSGRVVVDCCGPYLAGRAAAPTAEALMRSRYTAFARHEATYLLATWDPARRPAELDFANDETRWEGLEIRAARGGETDAVGEVEFVARYSVRGRSGVLHEISRFRRCDGRWFYVDGTLLTGAGGKSPGRNAPCPCGSGRKYKRCCGA